MYRGWITVEDLERDARELKELGVELGPFDEKTKTFNDCKVADSVFQELEPLWGRLVWGLEPVADPKRLTITCGLCLEAIEFGKAPVSEPLGFISVCQRCSRLADMYPEVGQLARLLLKRIQALEERIELLTHSE